MPKGMFSQGMCVLTTREIPIKELGAALESFDVLGYPKRATTQGWQVSGPSLLVPYRKEVNGKVVVDTVNHTWPDAMGDPKQDANTFAAWTMGHFGPFTFPGGLQRAGEHAWDWEPGKKIAQQHTGFIRVRSSYAFGAGDDAPVLPADYDAFDEMVFLTNMLDCILEVPGTLCYFNPGGEVLRDREKFVGMIEYCEANDLMPLPLWSNVRFFNLPEGWKLMDTVGNGQLDVPDVEIVFQEEKYPPDQIDGYMRNVTLHLVSNPEVNFKDGEKIDGPNESNLTWRIRIPENPVVMPPRRVIRLYPKVDRPALKGLLGDKW